LTADELKEVFNPGNNTEVDEKVWSDLIHEVDQNGDDKVMNFLRLENLILIRFLIKNLRT